MRFVHPLALWVFVVGGTACTNPVSTEPSCTLVDDGFGEVGATNLIAETVVDGLEVPWSVVRFDDGDLLVSERPGRVRLITDGALVDAPVLVFTSVFDVAEAGLLGLALHPRFSENQFLYVYVTLDDGNGPINRVERHVLANDRRSAVFDKVIIDDIAGFRVHDGGRIRFGPDGMLYVGTGDARQPDDSQNTHSLSGKILRLTDEGDIPDDNPFADAAAFISGIRNTQGFDWIDDDTLAVADHGPSGEVNGRTGHDELNVAAAGENLGWPVRFACEEQVGFVAPILTSRDAMPPGGLVVVDDESIPEWAGDVVVGTLGSRHLHRTILSDALDVAKHEIYFAGDPPEGLGRLRDVVNVPGGLLVTTSNCDGRGTCPPEGDKILFVHVAE